MDKEEVIKKLKIAKQEHRLKRKPGEVAIYDALIYIIESLG